MQPLIQCCDAQQIGRCVQVPVTQKRNGLGTQSPYQTKEEALRFPLISNMPRCHVPRINYSVQNTVVPSHARRQLSEFVFESVFSLLKMQRV